jgi:hypothetical protein
MVTECSTENRLLTETIYHTWQIKCSGTRGSQDANCTELAQIKVQWRMIINYLFLQEAI